MALNNRETTSILGRLSRSKFRAGFKLNREDIEYINRIGLPKITGHAREFINKRLSPETPPNDGRQTPFKGHPVFKAQHATATCCRGCLKKWHGIARYRGLSQEEKEFVLELIMQWLFNQSKTVSSSQRRTVL